MLINQRPSKEKNIVHVTWQRDPRTFDLLSLQTKDDVAGTANFPLEIFRNTDAWYDRMRPEDTGKELWLLREVYKKGSGSIRYSILATDGSEWLVTESMELKTPEGKENEILYGEWICERK